MEYEIVEPQLQTDRSNDDFVCSALFLHPHRLLDAISSKGFMDIFTLPNTTPEPLGLTRILPLKSTTRFTKSFICDPSWVTATMGAALPSHGWEASW